MGKSLFTADRHHPRRETRQLLVTERRALSDGGGVKGVSRRRPALPLSRRESSYTGTCTTFAPTYASAAFGSMAGESLLLTTAMRELFPNTSHRLCMGRRNLRSIGRGRLLLRFLLSFQSRTLA